MVIILHNPLSKNRKSKRITKKLVDFFRKNDVRFRVKSLLKIADLTVYLSETPEEMDIIILGGDGTINTYVNQTIAIPMRHRTYLKKSGSGNDFLRSLIKQADYRQNIMKMRVDGRTRYFMNGSGMGIDGEISNNVNRAKYKSKLHYFLASLKAFFTYRPKTLHATIDGVEYTFKKAYLINANNGAYIGGGMKLTPQAEIGTKELDIIIVHGLAKPFLFFLFLTVYLGFHIMLKPYVFYTKASYVKATMNHPEIAQCDGECFLNVTQFEASVTDLSSRFEPYEVKMYKKSK